MGTGDRLQSRPRDAPRPPSLPFPRSPLPIPAGGAWKRPARRGAKGTLTLRGKSPLLRPPPREQRSSSPGHLRISLTSSPAGICGASRSKPLRLLHHRRLLLHRRRCSSWRRPPCRANKAGRSAALAIARARPAGRLPGAPPPCSSGALPPAGGPSSSSSSGARPSPPAAGSAPDRSADSHFPGKQDAPPHPRRRHPARPHHASPLGLQRGEARRAELGWLAGGIVRGGRRDAADSGGFAGPPARLANPPPASRGTPGPFLA